MKRAIVVGSGAGGATVAKELQGTFDVTILEAGKPFRPFSIDLARLERWKRTGLFFDERLISLLFPTMKIRKARDKLVIINGIGTGGTTTLSTGNAVRSDGDLKRIGINLDEEFRELEREILIATAHQARWREITKQLFRICQDMGLNPYPTPKMGNYDRCVRCGRCVLGCPEGAKWDSRQFLDLAVSRGARLLTGHTVEEVVIREGKAVGIQVRSGWRSHFMPADLTVLAAGGLGTPISLCHSGIACERRLFVDPVLCVATESKAGQQNREIPMPFVVQRDRYLVSPYFDHLSFFFNQRWSHRSSDIVALMIKLADTESGTVSNGRIDKGITEQDRERLREGVALCEEILGRLGAKRETLFLGTLNAGHPGGMLPLTGNEENPFHDSRRISMWRTLACCPARWEHHPSSPSWRWQSGLHGSARSGARDLPAVQR